MCVCVYACMCITVLDPKPQYSAIMIDADSKDLTIGMSAPPAPFVTTEFLEKIKSITAPHGK